MAEFKGRATVAKDPEAFGSDYEKIEAVWVCMACGYMEDIDVEKEGTPAHSRECPECGAMMYRMNGVTLFHFGFTDTDASKTVQGVEIQTDDYTADGQKPELPQRAEPKADEPLSVDAVLKIKSKYNVWDKTKESVMTFRAKPGREKDFRKRVESVLKVAPDRLWRMLRAEADLLEMDGQSYPAGRLGVFGAGAEPFMERYTRRMGFSLYEARQVPVKFISDNDWKLTVEVEGRRMSFKPRSGYPFDGKQVCATVFEDFVRRFKNMKGDRGRALAFLQSCGELVDGAGVGASLREVWVVKPSSRAGFAKITEALNASSVFWEGGPSRVVIDTPDFDLTKQIINEVDPTAQVIRETTVSADIDPGFVVTKNQVPHYDEFKDKIEKSVGGKVIELGVAPGGGLAFVYEAAATPENWRKAHNLVLMMGDPFPKIMHEDGRFRVTLSVSPDQIQINRLLV